MIKNKKTMAKVLAVLLSLSFFDTSMVVKADEIIQDAAQQYNNYEIDENVNEDLQDDNLEEPENKIEETLDSEEENNEAAPSADDIIWGEDEDYTFTAWNDCQINDMVFRMNDKDSVGIYECGMNDDKEIRLPDKIKVGGKYYSVTDISEYAFLNRDNLTDIILPNGLINIGEGAFRDCINLENVTIPNGVENIGIGSFGGCENLKSITIPESVTNIGENAFYMCSSLKGIYVDSNNTEYSDLGGVLFNKEQTVLIKYPQEKAEKNFSVPKSVTSIKSYAFEMNKNLYNLELCDNITSIDNGTFYYCSNLRNVTMPEKLTSIGNYAFNNCTNLKNIVIPNGVTKIGTEAFRSCGSLSNVILSNELIEIGDNAFSGCNNLSSITIPESVKNIGEGVFNNCKKLCGIYVDSNNTEYSDVDSVLFNKDKTVLIKYPEGKQQEHYSVPESVKSLSTSAFSNDNYLTTITLPNGLESMDRRIFSCSNKIKSITIPESLTNVSSGMGFLVTNLESIWTSADQYNKFKDKFTNIFMNNTPVLIQSNLYNRKNYQDDVIKIKANDVKCFELSADGTKVEVNLSKDDNGYFVHDPQVESGETKEYYYEASVDGKVYTSPIISVQASL